MVNIGKFIKEKREAAGFTQEKLAKSCSLQHDSTLNRIENGNRKVTWEELGEISKVLGNFHIFEALQAAGFLDESEIHPILKIRHLEDLNKNELSDVQQYVDFLIFKKTASQKGV
ncbi:MAG: helix-turn-helix domain-containing protein [Eubacterium sp.]